mgnify:CR=1 FL=1
MAYTETKWGVQIESPLLIWLEYFFFFFECLITLLPLVCFSDCFYISFCNTKKAHTRKNKEKEPKGEKDLCYSISLIWSSTLGEPSGWGREISIKQKHHQPSYNIQITLSHILSERVLQRCESYHKLILCYKHKKLFMCSLTRLPFIIFNS